MGLGSYDNVDETDTNLQFKLVECNFNGELPVVGKFDVMRKCKGNQTACEDNFYGFRAGVYGGLTLIKAEMRVNESVKVDFVGPTCTGEIGVKLGSRLCIAALVDPAVMRTGTEAGPIFASVGLSGTTGAKLSDEGIKLGFFGFGITLGIGGRYSFDTPFCSAGIVFIKPLALREQPLQKILSKPSF